MVTYSVLIKIKPMLTTFYYYSIMSIVTQDEYNNLKQFVSKGGTIVFIDSNIFYAQVRYDKDNRTVTLVKGHNWQFDGKTASRSVSERCITILKNGSVAIS